MTTPTTDPATEAPHGWALTYMGHVLDLFDTYAEALAERASLYNRVKANQLPDFLDADDVEAVTDFTIRPAYDYEG